MNILVFNVGSTTLKYALIDTNSGQCLLGGIIDRIGQADGDAPDHISAAELAMNRVGSESYAAVGHRIVQGGSLFSQPTRVNEAMLEQLRQLDTLAPLHNPPAREVIEALTEMLSTRPQFGVFDTAYFSTLEPAAYRYAIPNAIYEQFGVRRYGFHGTSHQYVTNQAIDWLTQTYGQAKSWRVISLHLGGGASATASCGGQAVDTTMGMTPLEGLVMATRCGDLDPSIPLYLQRTGNMSVDDVDRLLNKESGLLGMCGQGDMREILSRRAAGDQDCELAVDLYVRRLRKTIGSFIAVLGGLDALLFTAGVGENAAPLRWEVTAGLSHFGIEIDQTINQTVRSPKSISDLSQASAAVKTLVVPTNEELAIAQQVRNQLR